jgi:hypothetical protein
MFSTPIVVGSVAEESASAAAPPLHPAAASEAATAMTGIILEADLYDSFIVFRSVLEGRWYLLISESSLLSLLLIRLSLLR